jgi:hypothetical protein
MRWAVLSAFLLLQSAAILADDQISFDRQALKSKIPEGWRLPSSEELKAAWRADRPDQAAEVYADLDGDKAPDLALLAVAKDRNVEGLLVWLSSDRRWRVLDKGESNPPVFMGLELIKPGKLRVLCETGEKCASDGKREITLRTSALSYYRPASAGYVYIFSTKKREFIRRSDSD